MATPQPAIFNEMGRNQWYVHLSRVDGADVGRIRTVLRDAINGAVGHDLNLCVAFGPTLLSALGGPEVDDFQAYETFVAGDGSGREAKGTQEELLLWWNGAEKDMIWEMQFNARTALAGHMSVARETPTFIWRDSWDLTGFVDGTGNPEDSRQPEVALIPEGSAGAGGSFCIAQRWVHDLDSFNALPLPEQEGVFGRQKAPYTGKLADVPATSHVAHVELRESGNHGQEDSPKRDEIARRSTPYAFHDGTVGLYFMGFCRSQAPLRERMNLMYNTDGSGVRDQLTDFSNPASGSFYFAPSVEDLNGMLA
ncbi:MAG: Dyp-type peroxidase [Acidimicrobiales bacterium]